MKIYVEWTEEVEYSMELDVPGDVDPDDYASVSSALAKASRQYGGLQADEAYHGDRVVQHVERVDA